MKNHPKSLKTNLRRYKLIQSQKKNITKVHAFVALVKMEVYAKNQRIQVKAIFVNVWMVSVGRSAKKVIIENTVIFIKGVYFRFL